VDHRAVTAAGDRSAGVRGGDERGEKI